jgi:hypothetical protein
MYVCMYVCMQAMALNSRIHTRGWLYDVCVCVVFMCTGNGTAACTRVYAYIYTYIHTYTPQQCAGNGGRPKKNAHTHTHAHTHTNTHKQKYNHTLKKNGIPACGDNGGKPRPKERPGDGFSATGNVLLEPGCGEAPRDSLPVRSDPGTGEDLPGTGEDLPGTGEDLPGEDARAGGDVLPEFIPGMEDPGTGDLDRDGDGLRVARGFGRGVAANILARFMISRCSSRLTRQF